MSLKKGGFIEGSKKEDKVGFVISEEDAKDSYIAYLENRIKGLDEQIKKLENQEALTSISKKLGLDLNNDIETYVAKLTTLRATILDHFALAYMAESGLTPSESALVQYNDDGVVSFQFEKKKSELLI